MRNRTRDLLVVGLAGALLAATQMTRAAPGDRDPTFGNHGKVLTDMSPNNDRINDIAIQADGKIVVAGTAVPSEGEPEIALARYHPDGTLDTASDDDPGESFGGDGKVITPIGGEWDVAWGVGIQPDGKIVVAGEMLDGGNYNFALVRYNTDGTLDTATDATPATKFGTDGIVTQSIASGDDSAYSMLILPNGKIVAAGEAEVSAGNWQVAVARFNPDGTLDTNTDADPTTHFGTDGIVTTDLGPGYDAAFALVRGPDGKIVVGGVNTAGTTELGLLVRYNRDGSLDDNGDSDPGVVFGTGGIATVELGTDGQFASLARYPGGKMVGAGNASRPGKSIDLAVARVSGLGELDSTSDSDPAVSFSGDGVAYVHRGTEVGRGVAVHPSRKVVAVGAGYTAGETDNRLGVVRFRANGKPDREFGANGQTWLSPGGGGDAGRAVELSPSRKILVGGESQTAAGNGRFVLMRLVGVMSPASISVAKAKTAEKINVSGRVTPNHAGDEVRVTLLRKKDGRFKRIHKATPTLNAESRYHKSFARPDGGTCRVKAVWPGDADHKTDSAKKTFAC